MSENGKCKVGIVGTGMIGASQAVLFTGNGYETVMLVRTDKGLASGLERFETYYKDLVADKLLTQQQADVCRKYLKIVREYDDLAGVDCILESVVEDTEAKRVVYHKIAQHCPNVKAVASATSSIPPDELSEGTPIAEKFLVAHPFNPAHMVPCVEIIRGLHTTDEATDFVVALLKEVGRVPVELLKSTPGFIINRLQQAIYRESVYMVENGITTPEDIDKALQYSIAPRYTSIGLFEHFDNAGLDLNKKIGEMIFPTLCNSKEVPESIVKHCEAGEYGLKSGKGMLDWTKKDIVDFRKRCGAPFYRFFDWNVPQE